MPRAKGSNNPRAEQLANREARKLLVSVVTFLKHSGLSEAELLAECRLALRPAPRPKRKFKVVHVGSGRDGTNIVNRWLRDPTYLNHAGKPADLPLRGERSVVSLVRACQGSLSPSDALGLLIEYGNVKKVGSAKYRLVQKLMNFGHPEYKTFEPNFRFLCDAAKVSTKKLGDAKATPGLFWQCADNARIHPRKAQKFLQFARERSLSFMHEMNDWLDEHEIRDSSRLKKGTHLKRLGVGLFGICSDPE